LAPTNLPLVTLTLRYREPLPTPFPSQLPPTTTPVAETVAQARIHAARPGDTLLGISLDYGVDVSALRQANPEIDPLALQVGQQIVIPPPGTVVPVATPIMLDVPNPECRETITGKTLCLGKVINTQAETVAQVRVNIRLLDAAGAVLAETTTGVEQILISPGGAAPYSAIFDVSTYANVSASILLVQPADQSGWISLGAEATDIEVANNRLYVEATIRNPSTRTVGPVRIVLTLFDSKGQIAGFRVDSTDADFEPGETRTIMMEAVSQSDEKQLTFQLHAEGRLS
jgi:LysM repeat protein